MHVRKQTPLLFVRGDKWREKTHQSDIPPLVFFCPFVVVVTICFVFFKGTLHAQIKNETLLFIHLE